MELREAWHRWLGKRVPSSALPDACLRGRIELVHPVPPFAVGDRRKVSIAIANESACAWPSAGEHRVCVGYWWRADHGPDSGIEGKRTPLRRDLAAGGIQRLELRVRAPNTPDRFWLEIDLVQQGGARFAERGSAPLRVRCPVIGTPPPDFGGYEDAWARADLERDHWSIVGPGSEAEFDALSRVKLKLLTDRGLTPAGRVLDVGCGTGVLTSALAEFLDGRGRYVGTDLSAKAVEFCRRRYTRPNFEFAVNEITSLPIGDGAAFDVIAFFSVFTHTTAEETDRLLGEAERLLAPNGIILADCFFSPEVAEQSGNRAMRVLGEQHFQALLAKHRLRGAPIGESFWDGVVRRPMLEITRRAL
ncbi:MAG TPA: class I SAM-dependent methyltransferase [Myxococcota bacterium]|nr:class I SAM-dependent methyltransferase [Myxococcota bacterium]